VTLKSDYFIAIGSGSVKTVADSHRRAAYRNKHCRWRTFQCTNIDYLNDLEPPKQGFL